MSRIAFDGPRVRSCSLLYSNNFYLVLYLIFWSWNKTTQLSHWLEFEVFLRLTCLILLRVPLQSPPHEVILYTLSFKAANNEILRPARMYKEFLQFNSSESFQVYYRA